MLKEWVLGPTPNYRAVASKLADQTYPETPPRKLKAVKLPGVDGAIVKLPGLTPCLVDDSKKVTLLNAVEENIQRVHKIITQLGVVVWATPTFRTEVITKILSGLTEQDIYMLLAQASDPELVRLIIACQPKDL